MKKFKISSKKKSSTSGKNETNSTFSTDDAVYGPSDTMAMESSPSKVKRKKFGLFSKSKSKAAVSTPQRTANKEKEASTPDTVPENDEFDLTNSNVLSVVPDEETAAEINPTLSTPEIAAKSLLEQLDMAETTAGADGTDEEGTELILPMPNYKNNGEDENEEETNVQRIKTNVDEANETVDNNRITIIEKPAAEPTKKNNAGDAKNGEKSEEESDEGDSKNLSVETEEERNQSIAIEGDQDGEEDIADDHQDTAVFQRHFVGRSAVKIFATAFGCGDLDTVENCPALPIVLQRDLYEKTIARPPVDLNNMFDDQSGTDFLNEMLNVGFTLIYHIAVEEDSWVGRTVSLVFQPGVCSARTIVQPAIEWNTMAGGKSSFVESKRIGLLDIDAIAPSNVREEGDSPPAIEPSSLPIPAKPPTNAKNDTRVGICSTVPLTRLGNMYGDEFDCFFTITTQDGEIHLFEALDAEDCRRIIAGIRFNAQRLSRVLIEGDSGVLMSDFYDNSKEPEDSVMSDEMVLNRLSNAFFDEH